MLKGKRIFIVEDHAQNRIVFTMALQMYSATIEFDRWGRDALWRLAAFQPVDLIILDLMLPNGVTGYSIFKEIRRVPDYDKTPILAVSASEPAIALPKTRAQGFAGFIAKPIDTDLFYKQVAQIMAGEQIWYAGERYQGIGS